MSSYRTEGSFGSTPELGFDALTQLCARTLSTLHQNQPTLYRELCLAWNSLELTFYLAHQAAEVGPALAGHARWCSSGQVRLRVSRFVFEPPRPRHAVGSTLSANEVSLVTSIQAMLELIDGQLELEEALHKECVKIRASAQHLLQLDSVLRLYLSGAATDLSFPGFLAELRELATEHERLVSRR